MILGVTGHRPAALGGYILPNPIYNIVCQQTEKIFRELKPDKLITGMCIGYDQWAANIAIKLGIPFIAAVPFEGQENKWLEKDRRIYHKLLSKAQEIVYVSLPGYSSYKMQLRNEWIVNNCDILVGVFNGSPGGTANCIKYAQSIKKDSEIIIINPS